MAVLVRRSVGRRLVSEEHPNADRASVAAHLAIVSATAKSVGSTGLTTQGSRIRDQRLSVMQDPTTARIHRR